ncbi:DUF2249 domain-containing protein [Nitrosophilus alvini]|uniref:DUF2249 domain-containing protein n=1 Tax=Nitrosophilus alvini TaxID=2714855 RepID=UPI00190CF9A0|nr:DUF2249 domain-containing protein [Nitrosophilus alvini]
MKEILIDTRDLEPPEPMQKVMQALRELEEGEYVHMVHRFAPLPFLDILKNNAFAYKLFEHENGADLYICKNSDTACIEYINKIKKG